GQAELAGRFNTSKVPVREALKQLHAEGLLDHDHNRGYFVTRLSFEEGLQLYRMRRWVEYELLRGLQWPDAAEIARLRGMLDRLMARPTDHKERDIWLTTLEELRYAIFSQSKYTTLLSEAFRLWALTDRYRALLPTDRSPYREQFLIDAMEGQDREALLDSYLKERDRIESMLADAFGAPQEDLSTY
ncbi:MAG: GntR family transcriptional regulator, partial [Alphaproteobacteria bacterium PA3]